MARTAITATACRRRWFSTVCVLLWLGTVPAMATASTDTSDMWSGTVTVYAHSEQPYSTQKEWATYTINGRNVSWTARMEDAYGHDPGCGSYARVGSGSGTQGTFGLSFGESSEGGGENLNRYTLQVDSDEPYATTTTYAAGCPLPPYAGDDDPQSGPSAEDAGDVAYFFDAPSGGIPTKLSGSHRKVYPISSDPAAGSSTFEVSWSLTRISGDGGNGTSSIPSPRSGPGDGPPTCSGGYCQPTPCVSDECLTDTGFSMKTVAAGGSLVAGGFGGVAFVAAGGAGLTAGVTAAVAAPVIVIGSGLAIGYGIGTLAQEGVKGVLGWFSANTNVAVVDAPVPLKAKVPKVRGLSEGLRRALAKAANNSASILSYMRAFRVAQDKARAAINAGNKPSARKQVLASAGFALKAAQLTKNQVTLDRSLARALRRAGAKLRVTKKQMQQLAASGKRGKLPARVATALRGLRITRAERALLAKGFAGIQPAAVDGLAAMTAPQLESRLQILALALKAVGLGIKQQAAAAAR